MWTFVALLILLVSLWLLYRKHIFSKFKKVGIPGPEPNLLFGNILDIVSKTPLICHTEWLKKYGKVVGYYYGTTPVVLIADVNHLKRILISDFQHFMNRPNFLTSRPVKSNERREGISQQLVNLKGKRWKDIRSIITPSFTASKMKQMSPQIHDSIQSFLNNVDKKCSTGEGFDIYKLYQALTMHVIGKTALGIQTDCQNNQNDTFLRSAKAVFALDIKNPLIIIAASFRSLKNMWIWLNHFRLTLRNSGVNPVKELIESIKSVLHTRRKIKESRRPDILQLMLDAEVDVDLISSEDLTPDALKETQETEAPKITSSKKAKKMTDDDIVDNCFLFLLAGYETTNTALAFVTHVLLLYPEVQEKIRNEVLQLLKTEGELNYSSVNKLSYLDQVVLETLRVYPPVYAFITREVSEDIDLEGVRLKKGMNVQAAVYNLHKDPELWEEPDEFRPERFSPENKGKINPIAFQPFGAGPRNCIGMRFALMEVKLTIAKLLSKYKLETCSKTEGKDLVLHISNATIKPKRGVWTRVVPVEEIEKF